MPDTRAQQPDRILKPRRLLRTLLTRLLTVLAIILVFRLTPWLESLAFYHPEPASRALMHAPAGAEDVFFKTADGLTLHGWFVPAAGADPTSCPTILHCHGNAGNLLGHADYSMFLAAEGFNVFLFDYRGYGASGAPTGSLTRADLMIDTRAALDAVASRPDVNPARIGVLGVSIGNAFSTELAASDPRIRACVAAAPFASWQSIAHTHAPVLGPLLVKSGLDPERNVQRMRGMPLLVIHGDADEIIPVSHGKRVAKAAGDACEATVGEGGAAATMVVLPGVGHNEILIDDRAAQQRVAEFFRAALTDR